MDWTARGWPAALTLVAGVVAFAWAAALLLRRTEGLATPAYDLAFFQQVVWNVGRDGRWVSSFQDGSFLGLHFSPILVVPAVLERLLSTDVRFLSLIHAMAIGALAPAIYLFAGAVLHPARLARPVAAGLAIMLPASAALQEVVRSDFHPEAIGLVMALLAGWAGLTRRNLAMWALAAVALATREDVGYAVAVVGLVVAARARGSNRRQGMALVAVALIWTGAVFGLVMPWFRAGARVDTDRYYQWLGGVSFLLPPFPRTNQVVAALTRPAPWFVILGMVISFAGLPLLRPRWLLLVAPPVLATLLSAHPPQAALLLQYPLILLVPLTAAAAFGARRALFWLALLRRRWRRGRGRVRRARHALAAAGRVMVMTGLILPAVGVAILQGSIPPFVNGYVDQFSRPTGMAGLATIAGVIPPEAPLFLDEGLAATFASRTRLGLLTGNRSVPADAYVLYEVDGWVPNARAGNRRNTLLQFLRSRPRPVIADDGRFVVLGPERRSAP